MTQSVFITGTDTDAGKTYVSVLLLQMANQNGLSSVGFKPISAGCERIDGKLRNADALALQAAANLKLDYDLVNPIAFEPPIAPHIAAQEVGQEITISALNKHYDNLLTHAADFVLVEGAGGWRLPLSLGNDKYNATFLSDFVVEQNLPSILVVGMKLGCLNHALLTYEQMQRDGANILGWIANGIDPEMIYYQENLATLKASIDVPLLGEVGYGASQFTSITTDLTNLVSN